MDAVLQIIKEGFLDMIPKESGDWLPLIVSIFSTICLISTSYIKDVKKILILLATANLTIAISYFLQNNINGAISCGIGAVTAIVSGIYDIKGKEIPLYVSIIYGVVFTVANLFAWEDWLKTGIVLAASLMFVISTIQKTGRMYRVWTIGNIVLWIIYDLIPPQAGGALVSHLINFVFMMSGMIIDIVRAKKIKG